VIPADSLRVELGTRSYDIKIGENLIAEAGVHIAPVLKHKRVFIISDRNVADLYLASLERSLEDADISFDALILPAGEETKDLRHLEDLTDRLLAVRIERRDSLIALGGGVIGDLAGFAAAVTLRGLDFIQVPTTLLAQVDSSVGGKTGINSRHGKNLIGAFHQPKMVLADCDALSTLPRREFLAGYAEVVKYGLIGDADFFTWLESHGAALIDGDTAARRRAVMTCCRAKAEIVAEDEREAGGRALLNLGHTFGHALEAEVGYGDELLHGEAVAIGMVMAFDLSVQLGLCPAEDAARVRRHFAALGLPTGLEALQGRTWAPDRLLDHMSRDKKVRDGRAVFVLTRGIGEAFIHEAVDPLEVKSLLTAAAAA
jgi:3-dehydroquinate synthase